MKHRRPIAAYTLIEVLVAAGILLIAVAAAGVIALATVTQEETNSRVSRCINLHEQATRLYQLGIEPAAVAALLPPDPAVVGAPVFTVQEDQLIPGLGHVDVAVSALTYTTTPLATDWSAGTWSSGESSNAARKTSTMTIVRPSLR